MFVLLINIGLPFVRGSGLLYPLYVSLTIAFPAKMFRILVVYLSETISLFLVVKSGLQWGAINGGLYPITTVYHNAVSWCNCIGFVARACDCMCWQNRPDRYFLLCALTSISNILSGMVHNFMECFLRCSDIELINL